MKNTAQQAPDREFAFDEQDFKFLSKLAYDRTGIVLADHKRDMVYGRLARRLRALKLTRFSDYCTILQDKKNEDEMMHLVNAITTNLTSLFREGHHFDHLRDEVLPHLKNKKLRIWSAACSSGMEPYSIALTLKGTIPDIAGWDARVLATDIDSNMLSTGQKGEYPISELEDIPVAYRSLVQRTNSHIVMGDELKRLIAFKHLNLLDHWPMKGPFDAIFCRNVVIYFDKPTKQKLFARMADLLKPGGWLYIGHSENLHGISDRFELLGRTIYRRIK